VELLRVEEQGVLTRRMSGVHAVGIAAAFAACVDCFCYVQHGGHFGGDYQTELISLDCARLRLTRWGHAVNIHEDLKLGRPDASASEVLAAKNALHQILVLFEHSQNISRTYMDSNTGDDLTLLEPSVLEPAVFGLRNKLKELAIRRQKGASILKTTSWALYRRSELKGLVSGSTSLIDSIEKLFPAPEAQLALVRQETAEIQAKQALKPVETSALGVDSLLLTAAKEAITGHQYLNVVIKGKAQTGDAFRDNWKSEANGASHIYGGVIVDKTGKALVGNKFGGTDFWDD
jgi:hypothetical protein